MPRKLTQNEWIKKAEEKHNNFYDYSLVSYIKSSSKVNIICPIHSEFIQEANSHLRGIGCPICYKDKQKNNADNKANFIDRLKKRVDAGLCYDYSLVDYSNTHTKIKIICAEHGVFEQKPYKHLQGGGCPLCYDESIINTDIKWIEKAKLIHKNAYDYSKVNYVNNKTKVCIICEKHGEFFQVPFNHISGQKCPSCSSETESLAKAKTTNDFIKEADVIHHGKYDYSLVEYKNNRTKVKIICKKHGAFEQSPNPHLSLKQGCPRCKSSKGEDAIHVWLKENGIQFIEQKRFSDCKDKRTLPFDFWLPSHNICIEFDGVQHYAPHAFGSDRNMMSENLAVIQRRDTIKNKFCLENDIRLIRISYKDKIEDILRQIFDENIMIIDINEWSSGQDKILNRNELSNISKNKMLIYSNEWNNPLKKDIWQSIINHKQQKSKVIYARKCFIGQVHTEAKKYFLDENHLQGDCISSINLGLYYDRELVALITLGKSRFNKNYEWEIVRYACKKYTAVVGGFSKLLKHFRSKNKGSIITYADKRFSDGNLYRLNGFEELTDSAPNYFYFKEGTHQLFSRVKFQKHKLSALLESFDPDKTEVENMFLNGYRRIWDCGNKGFKLSE